LHAVRIATLHWMTNTHFKRKTLHTETCPDLLRLRADMPTSPPQQCVRYLITWLPCVLEDSKKRGKSWQEIEEEGLWEERRDWRPFVFHLYKTETLISTYNNACQIQNCAFIRKCLWSEKYDVKTMIVYLCCLKTF
jgi:hypothetical protein